MSAAAGNRIDDRAAQILCWAHDHAGPDTERARNALLARLIAVLELKP